MESIDFSAPFLISDSAKSGLSREYATAELQDSYFLCCLLIAMQPCTVMVPKQFLSVLFSDALIQ